MANRTPIVVAASAAAIVGGALLAARRRRTASASSVALALPVGATPSPGASPEALVPRRPAANQPPDDVTLTRKVETELFRSPEVPRGNITVDAHDGVVTLRGHVDSEGSREDLAQIVGNVAGVRHVRNDLELSTAAP